MTEFISTVKLPVISLIKNIISHLPGPLRKRFLKFHYLRKFRTAKLSDDKDLSVLPEIVSSGQTVLDIGANFGLYTRFLSDAIGEKGQIYAFEPTEDMFEVLQNNVKVCGLKNTTCIKAALSDKSGNAQIHIPKYEDGTLNYYEASLVPVSGDSESTNENIPMTTIDEFCEQQKVSPLHFIKCDVEGHEIEVLTGASAVLQRDQPIILLEINEYFDDNARGTAVVNFIKSIGYEIYVYEYGEIHPWKKGYYGVNYILYPSEKSPK